MLALLLTALLALAPQVAAAPCCGAGSAAPTILTGDDRAQVSAAISHAQVIGDAPAVGLPVFRADGNSETTETLRIEGAILLSDRWQAGMTVPLMLRSRGTSSVGSASASGLGDVSLSSTYEILPEWEYSIWKPRGYVFGLVGVPAYSANERWALESRGRGFYSAGFGALLVKNWGDWDSSLLFETHRAFARTFSTNGGELRLTPGWGGSVAVGAGYSLTWFPIRMGLALSPVYESSILTQNTEDPDSLSARQLVWNTSVQLGWMATRASTLTAIYTDQTLWGPARNVSLSRTIALLFQQRWER